MRALGDRVVLYIFADFAEPNSFRRNRPEWIVCLFNLKRLWRIGDGRTAMRTSASGEAKNRFGELLDTAPREPVMIEKHGRRYRRRKGLCRG